MRNTAHSSQETFMPFTARSILAGLALAAILTSTPVSANTVKFSYSQTELSTAVGAEQVLDRISTLPEDICHEEFTRFAPRHKMKIDRCKREIIQEVVDEISHENLDVALTRNSKTRSNRVHGSNLIRVKQ
jgi:UrcA family protein